VAHTLPRGSAHSFPVLVLGGEFALELFLMHAFSFLSAGRSRFIISVPFPRSDRLEVVPACQDAGTRLSHGRRRWRVVCLELFVCLQLCVCVCALH